MRKTVAHPSGKGAHYLRFFQRLIDDLREDHGIESTRAASSKNWQSFNSGTSGFTYAVAFAAGRRIRVGRTLGERIALMGGPFLVERGVTPSEDGLGPALMIRLLLELPLAGGYFRPPRSTSDDGAGARQVIVLYHAQRGSRNCPCSPARKLPTSASRKTPKVSHDENAGYRIQCVLPPGGMGGD